MFGAALSYPVIRSRQQTLNVNLAFDALDSDISISPQGTPRTRASYDALRVMRLGADYALSDLWLGADRSAVNLLSVRISEGLKLLGASTNGNSLTSPRLGEQTGFIKINFEASRTQTLFTPWEGASVGLMGLLTGQWSDNILPPAEQFYLGGARFTRGYYAGQVPGDKALAATVELQLNTGFETTVFERSFDISTQFYLFYDWGETWQNLSADRDAMINSVGRRRARAGHPLCRGRFRGACAFQPVPERRQLPWQRRLAAVRRRVLLAGSDQVLTQAATCIVQVPVTAEDGMATARRNNTVRVLGVVRRNRRSPDDEHGVAGDRHACAGAARPGAARAECPADRRRGGRRLRDDQPHHQQHQIDQSTPARRDRLAGVSTSAASRASRSTSHRPVPWR